MSTYQERLRRNSEIIRNHLSEFDSEDRLVELTVGFSSVLSDLEEENPEIYEKCIDKLNKYFLYHFKGAENKSRARREEKRRGSAA
jgi:hypothetical protein